MRHLLAIFVLAFLAVLPAQGQWGPQKPLARGKGFLLHALPGSFSLNSGELRLLHTRLDTGEMRTLLSTGWHTVYAPPTFSSIPAVTNILSHRESRLLGVLADERIYIVTWQSHGPGDWNGKSPKIAGPRAYRLRVYRLADGKELLDRPFTEGDFPKETPPETRGAGPLTKIPGGVRCYGVEFTLRGDKLLGVRRRGK